MGKRKLTPAQQEAILRKATGAQKKELASAAEQLGNQMFRTVSAQEQAQENPGFNEPQSEMPAAGSFGMEELGTGGQNTPQFKMESFDPSSMSTDQKLDQLLIAVEEMRQNLETIARAFEDAG